MNLLEFINCAAHTIAFLGVSTYMVLLFGRSDSRVYTWPIISTIMLRVFLALMAIGHLVSAFDSTNVLWQDVLLNVGFAMMWPWVSWFYYGMFITKKLR